jgi:hypothetical protein
MLLEDLTIPILLKQTQFFCRRDGTEESINSRYTFVVKVSKNWLSVLADWLGAFHRKWSFAEPNVLQGTIPSEFGVLMNMMNLIISLTH